MFWKTAPAEIPADHQHQGQKCKQASLPVILVCSSWAALGDTFWNKHDLFPMNLAQEANLWVKQMIIIVYTRKSGVIFYGAINNWNIKGHKIFVYI